MKWNAILFDMDGTLLPMDQEVFAKGYFKELAAVLSPLGIAPEALIAAVWDGVRAMTANDGTRKNEEAFWERFKTVTGKDPAPFIPAANRFYSREFQKAKQYTWENPLAREAVELARKAVGPNRQKGGKVILATNPLFPMDGQITRMGWVGLKPSDFDLVTCYETDCFCKPNPRYYESICQRMGLKPEECLMIGNDENEDMASASSLGMGCYLVTDCCIKSEAHPWKGERGTFSDLIAKLKSLL